MKILIDNGHGVNTPGKCSPDGKLREWKYTREIAKEVFDGLMLRGIDAERIVAEDIDVSLVERCKRANKIYLETGRKAVLVSIHCNAAGNGQNWFTARGWSVFIANNASDNSKSLAICFAKTAARNNIFIRQPTQSQVYWTQNLAICRDTNCPAVLTENFFQDNKEDVEFLLSGEGKRKISQIHIEGILDYLKLRDLHEKITFK